MELVTIDQQITTTDTSPPIPTNIKVLDGSFLITTVNKFKEVSTAITILQSGQDNLKRLIDDTRNTQDELCKRVSTTTKSFGKQPKTRSWFRFCCCCFSSSCWGFLLVNSIIGWIILLLVIVIGLLMPDNNNKII